MTQKYDTNIIELIFVCLSFSVLPTQKTDGSFTWI